MESKKGRIGKNLDVILLVLLALFAPIGTGFQYLTWSDSSHLTYMIGSLLWSVTYSDWYSGVPEAVNGWLITFNLPIPGLPPMDLEDIFWVLGHISPAGLLIGAIIPATRFLFVAVVALFRRSRTNWQTVKAVGLLMLATAIVSCVFAMTVNVIYGIPPGVLFLVVAPDTDSRLFLPLPILLLVGMFLVRRRSKPSAN
ncbi:MAG: hypothetical protein ACE5H4_15675 [Candidatus Thorarchaeota archaeon]